MPSSAFAAAIEFLETPLFVLVNETDVLDGAADGPPRTVGTPAKFA